MKTLGLALISVLLLGCMTGDEDAERRATLEWAAPVSIRPLAAEYIEVAVLAGGTSLVMRRSVDGTDDVVTFTSQAPGSATPDSTELLRVRNLNCCASPWGGMRLKSDGKGGAYLVWMERLASPPYRRLHGRQYHEISGLSNQWSVVGTPGNAVRAFDLSIREDGIGLLGWIESTPDSPVTEALGPSVVFATSITSSGPNMPERLSDTIPIEQSGFFNVATAVSSSGYRMVLWTRLSFVATISELWGTAAAPVGAWGVPTRISERPQTGVSVGAFAGAIGNTGNGVVAWEWTGSSPDIQRVDFSTLAGGSRWSTSQVLSQPAQHPTVGVTGLNHAYIAFLDRTQSASIQNSIKLARLQLDRLTTIEEATPSATQPYVIGRPSLSAMSNGALVLAWTATPRANLALPYVERRVFTDGFVWQSTEQVSRPGSAASLLEPVPFVGSSNSVVLSWRQDSQLWFQVARPVD